MAALDPAPAVLLNGGLEVLGTNRAFRLLYTDFGALPAPERNLVRWMLTEPAARRLHGDDWSVITADMIGIVRLNAGRKGPVGDVRRVEGLGNVRRRTPLDSEAGGRKSTLPTRLLTRPVRKQGAKMA